MVVDDNFELEKEVVGGKEIITDRNKRKQRTRRQFYKKSELTSEYKAILEQNNLDENSLVNINHENNKFSIITPLISERYLKELAKNRGITANNECAKAYKSILLNPDIFNITNEYLISFIPGQCKGNICNAVLNEGEIEFDSSHAFFPKATFMGGLAQMKNGTFIQGYHPKDKKFIYNVGINYQQTRK